MDRPCAITSLRSRGCAAGRIWIQAALVVAVLLAGIAGLLKLYTMRRAPTRVASGEKAIRVDGFAVAPEDFHVTITGHGTARPLRKVAVCAEVSGLVTNVHPALRVGGITPAGQPLFRLDARDYRAAEAEAAAGVEQSRQTIARYNEELRRNRQRLKTLHRNRDLAASEFERVRDLLQKHRVGSEAELEAAERALNVTRDRVDEMDKLLALAPLLIREAEAVGQAARARLARAQHQVRRCEVRAPFAARVCAVTVEEDHYVHAGTMAVTLADDSVLEIRVPLDAREAQRWLQFEEGGTREVAWFSQVKPVTCTVRWTEAPETHQWRGTLHRIEQFNADTRTLVVVVRVPAAQAVQGKGFPLVEGMFCSVEVPGRTLEGVCRVPRWAVSVDRTVYTAVDGRLVTRPVRVIHTHGDYALVDHGLGEGEILIVTRLADPLEGSLLELNEIGAAEALP
jgi:multidrug efflux pump subunit AcrA (membrane-fusion protein)